MIQKARLAIVQCKNCGHKGLHIYSLTDRRAEPLGKSCNCKDPSYIVLNGPTPLQWFEEMEQKEGEEIGQSC